MYRNGKPLRAGAVLTIAVVLVLPSILLVAVMAFRAVAQTPHAPGAPASPALQDSPEQLLSRIQALEKELTRFRQERGNRAAALESDVAALKTHGHEYGNCPRSAGVSVKSLFNERGKDILGHPQDQYYSEQYGNRKICMADAGSDGTPAPSTGPPILGK